LAREVDTGQFFALEFESLELGSLRNLAGSYLLESSFPSIYGFHDPI